MCIKETLTFRTTSKKFFKGKGFFSRGYKAERLNFVKKKISSADCKINFVVPSDLILAEHSVGPIGSIGSIVLTIFGIYTLLVNSCDRPTRRSIKTHQLSLA